MLPRGAWRGAWREARIAEPRPDGSRDPELPRLRLRDGAIVPLAPMMQHTDERPLDELTLLVSLDASGRAAGTLYEDDSDGFAFERGRYRLTRFEARVDGRSLVVREASHEGTWRLPPGAATSSTSCPMRAGARARSTGSPVLSGATGAAIGTTNMTRADRGLTLNRVRECILDSARDPGRQRGFTMNDPTGPASPHVEGPAAPRLLHLPDSRCARSARAWALCLVGSAALLAGCGGKAAMRQPRVPVTVARVELRTVPFELVASGTVEAIQSANVGSQVGGTIMALAIREGQEVRAGQALIRLDPRPFQAAIEQARGALGRDRAQWQNARLDAERAKTLFDQGLLAQAEWDQKRAAADALHATVIADSGAVERAALDLAYATIRAPVSGRSGAFNVHVGDLVKAATSEPLVTIVQLHPIRVRFAIPENQLPLLQRQRQRNPRVLVRTQPDDSTAVEGRLVFMDNSVDASTGTLLLKGEFENRDGRLWPGQFVEARLVLATEVDRIVVPATAVTNGQQGTYVYVMNADSTASSRPVAIARTQGDIAIVARGLEPGEIVVTDGQFRLSPGARVQVRKGQGNARS